MWVLSTDRAELHFFPDPNDIPDGFAALSHVWDKTEQSFQDVRRIQETCTKDGTNPRDVVCDKISLCCERAERDGYKWVWIDTCCIDKTSSAELSEAINSMFRYYSLARICYGYLRDVPFYRSQYGRQYESRGVCHRDDKTFLRSIWFKRGWTLQELLAPRSFIFLSSDWQTLGTRTAYAVLLNWWTKIPVAVLRLEASHTSYSIAQRMSWFGERKTTRLEDEAYCLLGLFDIHMPTLYGEGRNAFRRLQEEIMKQSGDTTLFAWRGNPALESLSYLFAPSPSAFGPSSGCVSYTPLLSSQQRQNGTAKGASDLGLPVERSADMTFSLTPHGVQAYIPIIECNEGTYADLFWSASGDDSPWMTPQSHKPSRFLLRLEKDPDVHPHSSSRRAIYCVGSDRILALSDRPRRANEYTMSTGRRRRAHWQTVLMRHRPPPHQLAPVRFDQADMQEFMHRCQASGVEFRTSASHWQDHSSGNHVFHPPVTFIFRRSLDRAIIIKVGRCDRNRQPGSASIWAIVDRLQASWSGDRDEMIRNLPSDPGHDCMMDHVEQWPNSQKDFIVQYYPPGSVILSFAPSPTPHESLILHASFAHG